MNSLPEAIGRYALERELGHGASASVHLARDGFTGREVAIKLFWHGSEDTGLLAGRHRALFLNEAALVGRLQHPHIAALLDAAVERDFSYVVMEYVPGGTLTRHTVPDALLPLQKVVEIVYKASRALEYAHRQGVIHRDIKPENILLTAELDVKLSDFGIALVDNATHTSLDMAGSPAYASPEQIADRPLGMQTDMWSLGVVLFQMLSGGLPYTASSHESLMYQIMNIAPPALATLRPDLPEGITALVGRALQKDPQLRHTDWNEFSADLASLVQRLEAPRDDALSEARKFEALRILGFFRDFREVEVWEVLRLSNWRQFADGKTVIREGERGDSFYVLVDGEVEVSRAGNPLASLIAGGCFGEMLYFEEQHTLRNTTVRAKGGAVALEIRAAALSAASDACQVQFNRAFLRILLARLEDADRRLAGS
jgi:CRP-like cAMP-binding protein/tRNA A-37 threonylcarbamoyl transferase component Bud32